jgi:PAS domain S-box-containing protein
MLSRNDAGELFERMPWAAMVRSLETNEIVAVNREFERVSGYARGEVLGKHPLEVGIYPDERDFQRKVTELARTGKVQNRTIVFRTKNGEMLDATHSAAIVSLDKQAFILVVFRDFRSPATT